MADWETPETRHEEKYENKSKVQGRSQARGSEMICGNVELIDRSAAQLTPVPDSESDDGAPPCVFADLG